MGNVKIIVALRAILINNFQFADQKQNTVPYIAVVHFEPCLAANCFAKGAVSNEACISGKALSCHEPLEGDRIKSARGRDVYKRQKLLQIRSSMRRISKKGNSIKECTG